MRTLLYSALLLLAASGSSRAAATITVLVGQNDQGNAAFAFNPSSINVEPGDTITFKNTGGNHNAHSTDAAFPFECGNNNSCVNGAAGTSLWTASVTVPASARNKTINYGCDVHSGSGMVGQITVGSLPVVLQSFDVD
jgi:plastocyanin